MLAVLRNKHSRESGKWPLDFNSSQYENLQRFYKANNENEF